MSGRRNTPDGEPKAPEANPEHDRADGDVVGFPRANLRRIWKDWAQDQIATGRARRKDETPSKKNDD